MEEEADTDTRGVDALKTLSQVAAQQSGETEGTRTSRPGSTPPSSGRDSTPLVPLAPAQKRLKPRSQDVSKTLGPSARGIQKVRGAGQASGQASTTSQQKRGSSSEREIREHRSAPEHRGAFEKELRSSKSAPDLGATALAAIRSIQAGTLQLDQRMRSKIAAAAKRVLEARELKRKASRDDPAAASPGEAAAVGTKAIAPSPSTGQVASSQPVPPPPSDGSHAGWIPLPQSLTMAAAIARGEPLATPLQAPMESGSTAGSPPKFHRPVPGPSMQAAVGVCSAAHRPFTVTTGVPRFVQGDRKTGSSEPSGPLVQLDWDHAPSVTTTPVSRSSSLVLSSGGIQLPAHTEVP